MTTKKNSDSSEEDAHVPLPPLVPPLPQQLEQPCYWGNKTIFKSGPLFVSSKGIGWTSWKKRWFILTRTSLVFFRSDPSVVTQKGSEVNLTLGGIDLNSSGSVIVKADKKLLTVIFPDGRDGRTFTLKADTLEDLFDWKNALEKALEQAPTSALTVGHNGIFRKEQDGSDGCLEQCKDKHIVKSLVIGKPILLALEDVDGSPSFLEKALKFIEVYGIKVEGILRQAADVEDVEHRIWEYEHGKTEFSEHEDAHVISDCVKYFLRELPSSPVPASCCSALLEACRMDRGSRANSMRAAICETFPEPNRKLLQRILLMMRMVASSKLDNRMSTSAVAACMAPLLLRPLLAGDCEFESDFHVSGDGSIQLLQAAAAANHAQAIVITLMEEFEKIFGDGSVSPEPGLDSDLESGSEEEEITDDDDESYEDDDDESQQSDATYVEDDGGGVDLDNSSSEACTGSGESDRNCLSDNKAVHDRCLDGVDLCQNNAHQSSERLTSQEMNETNELLLFPNGACPTDSFSRGVHADADSSTTISTSFTYATRRPTVWGRTSAKKNLSMESINYSIEDEIEIQRLEASKVDLQNRISDEIKCNALLQSNLEQRKKALHDRRTSLEQDVARLQEQLQREREKRMVLERGLRPSKGPSTLPALSEENMKSELEEISQAEMDISNLMQKVDVLSLHLNEQHDGCLNHDSSSSPIQVSNFLAKRKDKQKDEIIAVPHFFARSASKEDSHIDRKTAVENEGKQESSSLDKFPPRIQHIDPILSGSTKSFVFNPKRSATRSEGMNSNSSALTKLTARLNFLKERRHQIANELQNLNRGRLFGQVPRNGEKSIQSDKNLEEKDL